MDIESSILYMLDKSYTLEKFAKITNGLSFTIKDSQEFEFEFELKKGDKQGKYYFQFKSFENFSGFLSAFNTNIFDNIDKDINLAKNNFNFLSSYVFGRSLNFNNLDIPTSVLTSGISLSSFTNDDGRFEFSIEVQYYFPIMKFSLKYGYLYFGEKGDRHLIIEDDLKSFRESFLKQHVALVLDNRLDNITMNDYKVLHMIYI